MPNINCDGVDIATRLKILNGLSPILLTAPKQSSLVTTLTAPTHLATGVPQGSVLVLLFFSIYISPITSLASSFSVSATICWQYTTCISLHPSSLVKSTVSKTALSPSTPGAAAICYPSIPTNVSLFSLVLGNVFMLSRTLPLADHGKLLSVTVDNCLSMDKHVNEVSHACFYHLHALRHIWPAITAEDTNMIACSVFRLRPNYATQCCIA